MNYQCVTLTFKTFWQFKDHPHLKVTRCKKIINTKTGNILKYNIRGFYIYGKYIKRSEINKHIENIPEQNIFN